MEYGAGGQKMGGQDNDKAAEHDDWLYRYCGKGNKRRVGIYAHAVFQAVWKEMRGQQVPTLRFL